MKIGIATMPLCANYGGTLQNYALQKVLTDLGHEPITLRLATGYQGVSKAEFLFLRYPERLAKHLVKRLIGRPSLPPEPYDAWKKSVSGMERFVTEHIQTTPYLREITLDAIDKYGIEAVVVGSDQIWRPSVLNVLNNYFCGFAKDRDIPRISYAASFALDKWPFNPEMTAQIKPLIRQFKAVSVRERNAVDLCRENLDVEAQWVLDPTMLLDKEDYCKLCEAVPKCDKRFVFAYLLDKSPEKVKMAERVAKSCGCEVKYITGKVSAEDTIEKWLASFRDAEYVVTDSFHGTAFSLIFNKQFYCFYNPKRGNGRMDSLKLLTGLNDRFITSANDMTAKALDYNAFADKIQEMKQKSLRFLGTQLEA